MLYLLYLTREVSEEQILIYNDSPHRPNPDDAGPIVRRPMGLPTMASYDTAWSRTRVSVVTPLALRCSALDRCATREQYNTTINIM